MTIRTTCPTCGEVDMGPDDIQLSVAPGKEEGTYAFRCPSCEALVQKDADPKIVALLVSAGVAAMATEASRVVPAGTGTPLTLDDLIELHFELEDESALERFLQGV